MGTRLKRILAECLRLSVLVAVFLIIEDQVTQIRHDLHGSANGIAQAQSRYTEELSETKKLIRTAIEDSSLQFSQATRVFEESTELIEGERRELARLIDDRTEAIALTLRERVEAERSLLEGAKSQAQTNAALMAKLDRVAQEEPARMKRKMIFPTVQLRGSGTVGSGVLVYSEPRAKEADSSGAISLVLTAHHVVMEVMGERASRGVVEEVRVLGENDTFEPEVYSAELVAGDRDRDLALLRIRAGRRFQNVADLAEREVVRRLDVFTRAYAVGCPLGNRPLPTVGEISSKSKVVGDQVFWMLNAPTFFGNSGGGVYLASTCQLIGISSMIYTYGRENPTVVPHMGLFVSLETISDWLDAEGCAFVLRREPVPPGLWSRFGLQAPGAKAEAPSTGASRGRDSP